MCEQVWAGKGSRSSGMEDMGHTGHPREGLGVEGLVCGSGMAFLDRTSLEKKDFLDREKKDPHRLDPHRLDLLQLGSKGASPRVRTHPVPCVRVGAHPTPCLMHPVCHVSCTVCHV